MSPAAKRITLRQVADACPWTGVADGAELDLEHFPSFLLVRLASALQRNAVRAYLAPHDLTIPDWRVLNFVSRYGPVKFGEVAVRSSLDKAQVSRTVKQLQQRGLISAEGDPAHAQRLILAITTAGRRLLACVLPQASRAQAALLENLDDAERCALWRALHKLQVFADSAPDESRPASASRARQTRNTR